MKIVKEIFILNVLPENVKRYEQTFLQEISGLTGAALTGKSELNFKHPHF